MYSDDLWNLVYVCKHCNSIKSNVIPSKHEIDRLKERNCKLLNKCESNSLENKNTEELILEFKRVKQFLSDETKTSTLKGTREYVKQQEQIVHERLGEFKSKQEAREFWNAYNKYQDAHKADVYNLGSDKVQRAIKQRIDSGKSLNASAITRQMNKLIEQQALLENEINEGEYNELANSDSEEFENPFL